MSDACDLIDHAPGVRARPPAAAHDSLRRFLKKIGKARARFQINTRFPRAGKLMLGALEICGAPIADPSVRRF